MIFHREKDRIKLYVANKYPYQVQVNQLFGLTNYSAYAGNVEQAQHYAGAIARKHFKPDVVGERYN